MSNQYRAYPTRSQEHGMRQHCGQRRLLWNLLVEQFNMYSWRWGRGPNHAERNQQLTELRNEPEFYWLKEYGSSSVQQQVLRDFDRCVQGFFKGLNGRPKRRKKNRREGFCVRDMSVRLCPSNPKRAWLTIPKVGRVEFKLSRDLPCDKGMIRVTVDGKGRWHFSFPGAQPAVERPEKTDKQIGIDRGVATTLYGSDGKVWRAPSMSKRHQRKLVRLNQKLARQVKGSKAREETKRQISAIWQKHKDRTRNWVELMSTRLVREYDFIAFEDLQIQNMVKSPKPKPSEEIEGHFEPNGAAAKAGLNKAILSQCWGYLAQRTIQKGEATEGGTVIKVDPKNTSRSCHECGHTAKENRESQAVFKCVKCSHKAHADKNAALNILARALAQHALLGSSPGAAAA